MDTFSLLDDVVYQFRDLFGSQNFALFYAYIWGAILCEGRHTVSGIYLAGQPSRRYWSLVKFLSRGQWEPTEVVQRLIGLILLYVPEWVYVYDHTHAIKTGKEQEGLHFFRNHSYQKRNTNQSKFHWGHQFAGLGLLAVSSSLAVLFPVWVKLLDPAALSGSGLAAFESIVSVIPAGLIVFDRGFNNRKYFKILLDNGHQLLCRARKNAAFYRLPTEEEQPKKGRKKIYDKRIRIERLPYSEKEIPALGKKVSLAYLTVRTKMCPQPVQLVVIRTRPKKHKPYRYFLVYTTDLTLPVETIVRYYKLRWGFETNMRETKENLGFDHYQVRSEQAIERSVLLSFVAASLTQLVALPAFQQVHNETLPSLKQGLEEMNIHWYHPPRWTLGLIIRYIRWKRNRLVFSPTISQNENTENKNTYSLAAG